MFAVRHVGARVGPQSDPGRVEQVSHVARDLGPEQLERHCLEGHERQLDLGAHVVGALGRHEGQLVERQGPRDAGGDDERDPLHVAVLDVLDEPVHALVGTWSAVGQRPRIRELLDAPDGDQERVVCE